ncbi:hypothetical protein Tco_0286800 [Tanacetum coccineum]
MRLFCSLSSSSDRKLPLHVHEIEGLDTLEFEHSAFHKAPENKLESMKDPENKFESLSSWRIIRVDEDLENELEWSVDVATVNGGDGGGDDPCAPSISGTSGNVGCLGKRGKGDPTAQFGCKRAGRAAYPPGDPPSLTCIPIWNPPLPSNLSASQQHLQKIYNGKKAALKERYWVPEEDGTYDLERLRRGRPHGAKSKSVSRQGSPDLFAALRDMHMETSATKEYPSLIHTFFLTHTVGGVFLNPEDKALYVCLQHPHECALYTEDESWPYVRRGKQRGHIPGVGRVLPGQGTVIPPPSQSTHSADIARLKKREKKLTKQVNMFMRLFRSDDKFSDA